MEIEDTKEAFAIPDLWRSSIFAHTNLSTPATNLFPEVDIDVPSIRIDNPYAPTKLLNHDLRLPDLETFAFGPLEEIETHEHSTLSITAKTPSCLDIAEEDIWKVAFDQGPAFQDFKFFTWDAFEKQGHNESQSAYLSDAGSKTFDAALTRVPHAVNSAQGSGTIIRSNIFYRSLLQLGLGRPSMLFPFDNQLGTFTQAIQDMKFSGYSLQAVQSLVSQLIDCGNNFRELRAISDHDRTVKTSPAKVAFLKVLTSAVDCLEEVLGSRIGSTHTLLQLQRLFSRPHSLLVKINQVLALSTLCRNDMDLLSMLYREIQNAENENHRLRNVLHEITTRTTQPFLQKIDQWVGLRMNNSFGAGLRQEDVLFNIVDSVEQELGLDIPNYRYDGARIPEFISSDDGKSIFETGRNLLLLQKHHPGHPLLSSTLHIDDAPQTTWKFSWADMERISAKAKAYEANLIGVVQTQFNKCFNRKAESGEQGSFPMPIESNGLTYPFSVELLDAIPLFNADPSAHIHKDEDKLECLVADLIDAEGLGDEESLLSFAPPIVLTPALSLNPLLTVQARLVNSSCLRLFFRSHCLRHHLSLQKNYHLFGDGVFISRLTSALFNPELETAERQRGVVRTGVSMGLKLGNRTNWPPASSELRLALMGILSDCYHTSQLYLSRNQKKTSSSLRESNDIPGNLSFAVRTLSAEDGEKCMDPHSLYALDFLRLQYSTPSPLGAIITQDSLEKYDAIFKFLLRLLRMTYVVSHLPRGLNASARKFAVESRHFVNSCTAYFFDTGISETWISFENRLDAIEQHLQKEDEAGDIGKRVNESLDRLKEMHERTLDGIMFKLLLRRRQEKVMQLLEEIFGCILEFSRIVTENIGRGETVTAITNLHGRLRSKITVFISVCKRLVGKKGYGSIRAFGKDYEEEENTIERLLLVLKMNKSSDGDFHKG
ncbi:hypothetical protein M501DRAFT_1018187 [Patellaria atrata CBS 101060]|uniref:Spindle pole body component n=1 Tax=Patellaria atrata CBS 101060 TaxID=1346257 RepID=A0A9P4S8M1_9PEZI|nr:hypothetical protein M501DRAFT_1018187 [Patellaria atrata CBS 101060]